MTGEQHETERDLACIEFVELVTDYLEGALPARRVEQVDAHLRGCDGCRTALAQWRTVITLTGRLTEDEVNRIDPLTRDQLMATFRRTRRR
jgi:anti-sigma factor RsiW